MKKCHICGEPIDAPGGMFCSYPHQMVPDEEISPGMWTWKPKPIMDNKTDKYVPSPKLHLQVSLFKSIVRILAGFALISAGPVLIKIAGACLIVAEVLGVIEELV